MFSRPAVCGGSYYSRKSAAEGVSCNARHVFSTRQICTVQVSLQKARQPAALSTLRNNRVIAIWQVTVAQLLSGGLSATYWDNQWLLGSPSVQRVDPEV